MTWGPSTRFSLVRPVRPVATTGQTGPAQAERRSFGFVLCRVSLKLMTLTDLITEDKYLGVTILPPKRNLVPRFNGSVKLER